MDHKKKAVEFCEKYNVIFKIELSQNQSAPIWATNGDKYGYKYDITIERRISSRQDSKKYSFNFWDSVANKENEVKDEPSIYSILACLTKYEVGTFDDFISEYGYEMKNFDEMMKTQITYQAVMNEFLEVESLFFDCMDELREIN